MNKYFDNDEITFFKIVGSIGFVVFVSALIIL